MVHLNSSKAGALGALAARLAGVPNIIFTAHGWAFNEARPWWQKIIIWKLAGITVLLSHKTICVSDAVRRDIAHFPFTKHKLVVIHNGIECAPLLSRDEARLELAAHSVGSYWIGMSSELHPTKRIGDAIRAMAILVTHYPHAMLIVMGEGQERRRLESLIHELHLHDRVFLAGFKNAASSLLAAFDLFLHTSISEALSLAILEAGCASLPVVATRVGGIPEIIESGVNGILVPPRNPTALAAAINTLIDDPQRAHALGAALKKTVGEKFIKERMLREMLALYH